VNFAQTAWGPAAESRRAVDDDQRDVVILMAGRVAGPLGDFGEQRVGQLWRRQIAMSFEKLRDARAALFYLRGVGGFEQAVGVEQTTVAGA
jgi:hypothetical protein